MDSPRNVRKNVFGFVIEIGSRAELVGLGVRTDPFFERDAEYSAGIQGFVPPAYDGTYFFGREMEQRRECRDAVQSSGEFEFRNVGESKFRIGHVFARHLEHSFGVIDTQVIGGTLPKFHRVASVSASNFQNVRRSFPDMVEYSVDIGGTRTHGPELRRHPIGGFVVREPGSLERHKKTCQIKHAAARSVSGGTTSTDSRFAVGGGAGLPKGLLADLGARGGRWGSSFGVAGGSRRSRVMAAFVRLS